MPQVQLFALLFLMLVIPLAVFWLALVEERRREAGSHHPALARLSRFNRC
jgi:hypothetical protein